MIKRLTWFVGGAVAGVAGAGVAKRKVKEKAADLAPAKLAKGAARRVGDAVAEGKRAMHAKEAELKARLHGSHSTLADEFDPDATLLVDGVLVEPGNVIVLRQVEDGRSRPARPAASRRRRA